MKEKRQRKIVELIEEFEIETQEELAKLLCDSGFVTTQATVSRDIKELRLQKAPVGNGKQKYILPDKNADNKEGAYMRVMSDAVLSMDTAGNILVVKTASGMAMAVAAAIDAMNLKEIIGCIAGDDTIMCIVKEAQKVEAVKDCLENIES